MPNDVKQDLVLGRFEAYKKINALSQVRSFKQRRPKLKTIRFRNRRFILK